MLEELTQCSKVLMIPMTSVVEYENPYLRPDHEVDLSFIAPPSEQGELLSRSGQCLRGAHVAAGLQSMRSKVCCLNLLLKFRTPMQLPLHMLLQSLVLLQWRFDSSCAASCCI